MLANFIHMHRKQINKLPGTYRWLNSYSSSDSIGHSGPVPPAKRCNDAHLRAVEVANKLNPINRVINP